MGQTRETSTPCLRRTQASPDRKESRAFLSGKQINDDDDDPRRIEYIECVYIFICFFFFVLNIIGFNDVCLQSEKNVFIIYVYDCLGKKRKKKQCVYYLRATVQRQRLWLPQWRPYYIIRQWIPIVE